MLDLSCFRRFPPVLLAAVLCLAGCGTWDGASNKIVSTITPYKIDIIQGNVVTREQLAVLQPGMSRTQVRELLGSALLTSVFHANRWDYVFTLKRPGQARQERRVTVFFAEDVVERVEADELPSEEEFAATLKSEPIQGPLPVLEAPASKLEKFPLPQAKPTTDVPGEATPTKNYPPLEPASR